MERIDKPWGFEEIIVNNNRYVIKRITVKEGHRLSLQFHKEKHETWFVISGSGAITLGERVIDCSAGTLVDIPPCTVHRVYAGKGGIVIFEVSTPELEDIVRLEDDYGRTKP